MYSLNGNATENTDNPFDSLSLRTICLKLISADELSEVQIIGFLIIGLFQEGNFPFEQMRTKTIWFANC